MALLPGLVFLLLISCRTFVSLFLLMSFHSFLVISNCCLHFATFYILFSLATLLSDSLTTNCLLLFAGAAAALAAALGFG